VVGFVDARDLVGALVERLEAVSPSGLTRIVVALGVPTAAYSHRGLRAPLDTALAVARRHDASLTIVHVMPWLSGPIAAIHAGIEADFARARLCAAREALWRLVPLEATRSVRLELRTGDVASGIVGAATEVGAELIVMGGRRRSSLVRATARRAACPVLAA
jgi:nucleotide-binding universal stress UspA family protein